MFYPDKNKKYVRIRQNHRNYQQEMQQKRSLRRVVIILVIAAAVGGSIFLGLPQKAVNLAMGRLGGLSLGQWELPGFGSHKAEEAREPQQKAVEVAEEVVEEEEPEPASLVFVGDVELSEAVQQNYDEVGVEGIVSKGLHELLTDADLTVIHHEFCISDQGTAEVSQPAARVSPGYVYALTDLGVNVASLANNHILDYGSQALLDTINYLNSAGINHMGAGNSMDEAARLILREENGIRFGFLACSHMIPSTNWDVRNAQPGLFTCYDPAELLSRVEDASGMCDYLFVILHWGVKGSTSLESYQTGLAHSLVDAGADAVIGSHPRVLQRVEYYNGRPIFYSLGNFISGQPIDQTVALTAVAEPVEETAEGEAAEGESAEEEAEPVKNIRFTLVPAYSEEAVTRLATESEDVGKSSRILDSLRNLSPNVNIAEDGTITER